MPWSSTPRPRFQFRTPTAPRRSTLRGGLPAEPTEPGGRGPMPGRRYGRRTPAALLRARSPWWGPVLALVVLVSGTVSELPTAPPASGSTVPSAAKPAKPAPAKPGVGFRSRDGWAGTWSVNGKRAFGIDLDSRDPSTATGYTGTPAKRLHRQVGWSANHRKGGADAVRGPTLSSQDLARLAYLADRYA